MKFISDKEIIKIPIRDNGERLVSLRDYCPEILINIDPLSRKMQKLPKDTCYLRESVVKRLQRAQKSLPKGYRLMAVDCYRSLKVQKKIYSDFYNKLKKEHLNWLKEKLKKETEKFIAPPEMVPPHSTGGAVDLTIVGPDDRELDMGIDMNTFNEKSYTFSKKISQRAKTNRKLLIKDMKEAGFVNYPTEWWHWSYGDKYWAAMLKKKYSIYRGI